jgi:hypothetical protein
VSFSDSTFQFSAPWTQLTKAVTSSWAMCNWKYKKGRVYTRTPLALRKPGSLLNKQQWSLGIDEDLVAVAALTSAPFNSGPGRKELGAWIRSLPEKEKNDLLVSAVFETGESWRKVKEHVHVDDCVKSC